MVDGLNAHTYNMRRTASSTHPGGRFNSCTVRVSLHTLPRAVNREVPSGMRPLPWVARILEQRFVLPELLATNTHTFHSAYCMASPCNDARGQTPGYSPHLAIAALGDVQWDHVVTDAHRRHACVEAGLAPRVIATSSGHAAYLRPRSPRCLRLRGQECMETEAPPAASAQAEHRAEQLPRAHARRWHTHCVSCCAYQAFRVDTR